MFCILFIVEQSWIIIYLNAANLVLYKIISLAEIDNK